MKEEIIPNVWKIGSRWSQEGKKERSIINLFLDAGIVFFGDNQKGTTNYIELYKDKIQEGDYFLIADGLKIYAVAKVIKEKDTTNVGKYIQFFNEKIIEKLSTSSEKIFDYNYETGWNNAFGWKVNIYSIDSLDLSQRSIKVSRKRIYKMKKYKEDVIYLYNQLHQSKNNNPNG